MAWAKALTKLKKTNSTPNLIAYDTEDNGQGAPDNFICACFFDGKRRLTFWDRDEARDFIFNTQRGSTIFFAHNLAYDLANVDYPEGTAKLIPIATRLIGARYIHPKTKSKYSFMDTGNFFVGASIEKLGEKLGYPKIKFDISRIKNKHVDDLDEKTRDDVSYYCMRDSEICYKTALHLVNLTHINQTAFKAYTAPALSMRIYRTNFLEEVLPCRDQQINDFERLTYYGGRTEVYDYRWYEEIDYEDINSSYPTAMYYKKFPYPPSYRKVEDGDWNTIRSYEGISLVKVNVPKMHIPPLPYRRKDDGRLIFPVGTWTGAYTHVELRMAEKYGVKILNTYDTIVYTKTYDPFKSYVGHFYPMKNTSKGIERDYYKLMLNGLSGKFGERRTAIYRMKMSDLWLCSCENPDLGPFGNVCQICKRIQIEGTRPLAPDNNGWISIIGNQLPDPKHTFPILISYVCSYGRIKLYEERLSQCDSLYCDTDSNVSSESPHTNIGSELGNWDLKRYRDFVAYAPKFYHYRYLDKEDNEWKTMLKLKGVPSRHTIVYVCDNCKTQNEERKCMKCSKDLDDRNKRYKFSRPLKLAEAIRRKKAPNQWHDVIKQIGMADSKRIKHNNGTSSPIEIFENESYNTFSDLIHNADDEDE